MTRQAINQQKYPSIAVPAHIRDAVKAWATANSFKMYKVGDLIAKLPEIKPYLKEAK